MRRLCVVAAFFGSVALALGATAAGADPQMLGVVQTAAAVPLHCRDGDCAAELSSICLQEARAAPTNGYPYTAHNPDSLVVIGTRRDGSRVVLVAEEVLTFSAARGYSAVRVSVPEAVLRRFGVASVEISVGEGLTLVPQPNAADAVGRLSDADIALGAGPLRRTATAIVDTDGERTPASQVVARMIDALPRRGRASAETRTGLWDAAELPHADPKSSRGVHRARAAYHACYRQTRLGDVTLRQCLSSTHDAWMQGLNEDFWDAVKTGT